MSELLPEMKADLIRITKAIKAGNPVPPEEIEFLQFYIQTSGPIPDAWLTDNTEEE